MEHRPLKRRRTSSISDSDQPRQKRVQTVFKQLQQTAEEVRCALNDATWLSVQERVRAALIIDHVAMISRMMEEGYEFGDGEMEEDDEEDYEDGYGDGDGDVIEEVVKDDLAASVVEDASGVLDGEDRNGGSSRDEGGDGDGDGDAVEEDEESYSSWIRRGVSFSAGAICTAYTESGGT